MQTEEKQYYYTTRLMRSFLRIVFDFLISLKHIPWEKGFILFLFYKNIETKQRIILRIITIETRIIERK